jgi:serine protease inhibitor
VWKHRFGNQKLIVISISFVSIILGSYVALVYYPESIQNSAYAISDGKAYSVDSKLVSANTKFAFDIFKKLLMEDIDENIFISPLSISIALAMTYNGAEGTTKDAMAKTLNFGNMTLEDVNQKYSDLIESLENVDQAVKLLISNSVWMKNEFEPAVKSSFLQNVGTSYDSEVFTRDFGSPQTVYEINSWVDKRTEGKIKEIVRSISPELVMLLINAIYFKGTWITEFDKAKTQQQDFFLPGGEIVKVEMMTTAGNFSYYSGEDCDIARLPYGRDKVAMYIFLPKEGVSLDSFIASMNQTLHDEYFNRLQSPSDLIVKMPKFEVEYGAKRLNNVLNMLGMEVAFDPFQANFEGIASTSENLYISYVDHKAVIEVNEEGTEAAAVTVVGMGTTSVSPSSPPSFVVDRPFYYEIRDDRSGSILFMGEILNPTET